MSKQIDHNLNEGHGGRPKIEPKSFSVNLEAVASLGITHVNGAPTHVDSGKGFDASAGTGNHHVLKTGGQGHHG